MHWSGFIASGCALVLGAWLTFDGAHALIAGDYVTPKSGRFAGQLGPWSRLVEGIGLQPRSILFMTIHVALGSSLTLASLWFAVRPQPASWWALVAATCLCLWYLPFGTLLGLITVVALALSPVRGQLGGP